MTIKVTTWQQFKVEFYAPQVFVEPGQSVQEGDTLVIMEAMKMEVDFYDYTRVSVEVRGLLSDHQVVSVHVLE